MPVDAALSAEISSAVDDVVAATNDRLQAEESVKPEDKGESNATGDDSEGGADIGAVDSDGGKSGDVLPESGSKSDQGEGETKSEGKAEAKAGEVAPSVPSISDSALAQAILAGIPISDAKAFASDESLLRVVEVIRQAAADQEQTDEGQDEDPLVGLPEFDPEIYDEKVIAAFDVMKNALKAQHETIKEFRSRQDESAARSNEEAARSVEKWFDAQVESLGDDFAETLGKGAFSALDRGSSQYAKRDAIASKMGVLLSGYAANGLPAPEKETVFQEATKLVLADEFTKVHERKLSKDLEKRAGQHISRPGGKKSKQTQSPLEETAALIDAKYFGKR
jgi:hypothetical protein